MFTRIHTAIVAAAVSTSLVASANAPARAENASILSLQTGHSLIIEAPGVTRIAVGDTTVAGIVPVGDRQLLINAKGPGHTTVFVWAGGVRTTYEVTVTETSFDDIARLIRSAIDVPTVQVVAFQQNMIVRGTVEDGAAFQKVQDVIKRFSGVKFGGHADGTVVNAVIVRKPLGTLQERIRKATGSNDIDVESDTAGNLVVSGSVVDENQVQNVLRTVRGLAGSYMPTTAKVVNRLNSATTSQIDVKVYVLEVDKSAQSQLGLRLQSANPALISGGSGANPPYTVVPQPSFQLIEGAAAGNLLPFGPFFRVSRLAPTVDLLISQGHAKILSSPDLVTTPGNLANFLVGGQIPIPSSNGLGSVSVSYQNYGVQLEITPNLIGDGNIETKIHPQVSDLDFADGVQINGFTIPALKTSSLSTDLITKAGESIVMGGLMRHLESKNISKIPLLSSIPIFGKLFQSTSYQSQDSDVVFVMTPYLVTK